MANSLTVAYSEISGFIIYRRITTVSLTYKKLKGLINNIHLGYYHDE